MKTIDNGLMVDTSETPARCVGYIFNFAEHGAFAPSGLVEINGVKRPPNEEEINTHNQLLAEAEITGLDQNCQIGQHGTFFWNRDIGVTTWTGVKVADYTLNLQQTVLTFKRNGKTYRGRLQKDVDCFNFKRVA